MVDRGNNPIPPRRKMYPPGSGPDGAHRLSLAFILALLFTSILIASVRLQAQSQGEGAVLHFNPEEVRKMMSGSGDELVDVNNQTTIINHLSAFQKATSPEEQQQVVSELFDYCTERGLRPSPDLAELFLSMAQELKNTGKPEDFKRFARFAETFDPGHPAVHLAMAMEARKQSGVISGSFLFETLNALFLSFRHPSTRMVAMANLALWLRITCFLLLGIISLLLFMKYHRLVRHDMHEWLGGQDTAWNHAVGWGALFLPSLLFLGGYWWCVYWAGLFLLYARLSERLVTLLAGTLLVLSGAFAALTQQELYLSKSTPHSSNLRCYANRIDVGEDSYLKALATSQDFQKDVYALLLANRYLVHGSYYKAEEIYKDLLARSSNSSTVANNLGCIYYFEGRYQEAIQLFTKAIEVKADMAIAYFNRSLALTKIFNITEAEADQAKARQIEKDFSASYNLSKQEDWGPVPVYVPVQTTYKMALEKESDRSARTAIPKKPFSSQVALIIRPTFSVAVIFLMVGFLILYMVKGKKFFSRSCFKCGRAFCSRCKTSLEFESFCGQCVHLYIKQDGVSPEARMKKNYEVEVYNRFLKTMRAVLSVVAPGAGHFIEGRPFSSLFLLLLWCGFVATFLLRSFALPMPFSVSTSPIWTLYYSIASVLMLLMWFSFGLPRALSRELPTLLSENRS